MITFLRLIPRFGFIRGFNVFWYQLSNCLPESILPLCSQEDTLCVGLMLGVLLFWKLVSCVSLNIRMLNLIASNFQCVDINFKFYWENKTTNVFGVTAFLVQTAYFTLLWGGDSSHQIFWTLKLFCVPVSKFPLSSHEIKKSWPKRTKRNSEWASQVLRTVPGSSLWVKFWPCSHGLKTNWKSS